MKVISLCGSSGFPAQGAQLCPDYCAGSHKTWPQNQHQHTRNQPSLTSRGRSLFLCLPVYQGISWVTPAAWHSLMAGTEKLQRKPSHRTIPVPQSSIPIPYCTKRMMSLSHSMSLWGAPLCPPVTKMMLSSSLGTLPVSQKDSFQALSLFPLLSSTLNIYHYSIEELLSGADKQLAKALFLFFPGKGKTNTNDIHWGFWYVQLDVYQPIAHQGKKWQDCSPCPIWI